jgi:hypothetical protein
MANDRPEEQSLDDDEHANRDPENKIEEVALHPRDRPFRGQRILRIGGRAAGEEKDGDSEGGKSR